MRAICEDCGESEAPDDGVYVDQRPNGNARELLCSECYADRLARETVLNEGQAEVWSLRDSLLSEAEIAAELEMNAERVADVLTEAVEIREQASQTVALTTEVRG